MNRPGGTMYKEASKVGVIMQRVPLNNRWQPYQWRPLEVVSTNLLPEGGMRCLRQEDADTRWLFSSFDIKLFNSESEGYFLNISSPQPCWFIMWRMEESNGSEIAVPKSVTLSYNEAARLMDGGEQIDTLPASNDIIELLRSFVDDHYRPEPKQKRKKPSFEGGEGVAKMANMEGDVRGRR